MKKITLIIILSLALTLLFSLGAHGASDPVNVTVNGKPVVFTQETGMPFLDKNGRTQVPLKVVLEALNVSVDWDGTKREAIVNGYNKVWVPIGKKYLLYGGASRESADQVTIDTEATIVGSKTYIPIASVLKYSQYSCSVSWNASTRTVIIQNQGMMPYRGEEDPNWISYVEWYEPDMLRAHAGIKYDLSQFKNDIVVEDGLDGKLVMYNIIGGSITLSYKDTTVVMDIPTVKIPSWDVENRKNAVVEKMYSGITLKYETFGSDIYFKGEDLVKVGLIDKDNDENRVAN